MYIARKHYLWDDNSYHQYDTAQEVLSNIQGSSIGFKAIGDLKEAEQRGAVQGSELVPNLIYFTPYGIMMGGHMIAEPTPEDEIEDIKSRLEDIEAVSGGALKFVGVINGDGCVEQINTAELPSLASQTSVTRSTSVYDNKVVYFHGTQKQITYIPIENIVSAICSQPIGSEGGVISLDHSVSNLYLFLPSETASDYYVNGQAKAITTPYTLTSQDISAIRTAYAGSYGGNRFEGSGVFLYIETTGSDAQALTQNTATFTSNAIKFEDLVSYSALDSGYVFVAQGSSTLIEGDSSSSVSAGDMVIISNDKLQVPNGKLIRSDFSIVRTGNTQLASPTQNGLMSTASWDRLWNDLSPVGIATKSDLGQIMVGDGLVVNESGKTDVKLAPTFEQLDTNYAKGVQLKIYGRDNGADLLTGELHMPQVNGVTVNYNPFIPTATQDRYGVLKIGTGLSVSSEGVVSATANLVWA